MNEYQKRLNTIRLQNMKSHQCDVTDEDYERIAPKIELLKRLSLIEQSLYTVYDMYKKKYLLRNTVQIKQFGTGNEDIDHELVYKSIHPDDLTFVLETDNQVYQFFSELPPEEKKNYKLVYDFRMKNTEGIYKRYMHQTVVLELDRKGKGWLTLVTSNLLSERAKNEKPQRRFINLETGKLYLFNDDYDINLEVLLTKREIEILKLITQGYDSKSISEKLFISVNTVNNHRQNILRKTRTDNTTQALLYAKRLGII